MLFNAINPVFSTDHFALTNLDHLSRGVTGVPHHVLKVKAFPPDICVRFSRNIHNKFYEQLDKLEMNEKERVDHRALFILFVLFHVRATDLVDSGLVKI